jgi:hypothetical protein
VSTADDVALQHALQRESLIQIPFFLFFFSAHFFISNGPRMAPAVLDTQTYRRWLQEPRTSLATRTPHFDVLNMGFLLTQYPDIQCYVFFFTFEPRQGRGMGRNEVLGYGRVDAIP